MSPTFSIIMPAWNRAYCIQDSIRSVLAQKWASFEVVVFDAGSHDGTAEAARALKDPRIKVGTHPVNKGVNFSRNRAIEMATGEWLILLDSDDKFTPDALEIISKDLKNLPSNVALIFYGTRDRATGKMKSTSTVDWGMVSYEDWLGERCIAGEFLPVVRRSVFKDEMFPEDMMGFEKYYWLKVAQKHKIMIHNIAIRIYEADDENRQTKKDLMPESAAPRARSYQKFLSTYGDDMKRVNSKLYAHYLSVMGHLFFLFGDRKSGRLALREAMKYDLGPKTLIVYAFSFLGKWPFYLATRIARHFA